MSKALRFPQITAEYQDCPVFIVILTIKTSSQNISITLLQIRLNFANIEAAIGEKALMNEKYGASKIGNAVISLL